MGLMSIVAGTANKGDTENILNELPVSDNIKNGLFGEEGLFGDIFRLVQDYERASWSKVDEFVEKYRVDSQQIANEYVKCLKFMQQFYIK